MNFTLQQIPKTIVWFGIVFLISIFSLISVYGQLSIFDNSSPTINNTLDNVLDTSNINDPLRDGSRVIVQSSDNNGGEQWALNFLNIKTITQFSDAHHETLNIIRNILNAVLYFISFVTLILLIIEWYKIVASGTDTDQYKKAFNQLKNYAIAIAWIALSWLIVNLIFYVIWLITA